MSQFGAYFWHTLEVDNATSIVHSSNIIVNATLTQIENNETNHLVQTETRSATLPKTPEHFTHDQDGNLTQDATWHYTWNAENRLTSLSRTGDTCVALSPLTLSFTYDHQGRRTTKTITTPTNTITHTFIYDGWNLISDLRSPTSGTSSTNWFLWGLDLSHTQSGAGGIGGLLACHAGGPQGVGGSEPHLTTYDGNGNLTTLYNPTTSTETAHYTYTPFGQLTRTTGPMATKNPFRFSTKYQDPEIHAAEGGTGLLYYGYRHYDPSRGRWLSRDPLEEWGGAALYGFVRNLVTGRVDPWGLQTNDPGEFGWDVYSPDFGQQADAGTPWDNVSPPEFSYPFLFSPIEYLNYKRNDLLRRLCVAEKQFVGRDDITNTEIDEFAEDYSVTRIPQKENIFHQRKEDLPFTQGNPERFRNHKFVWGRLPWQKEMIRYKPCELILRKNGCWTDDSSFVEDGTWSYEDTSYARGTHNFGGSPLSHTLFDVLPWIPLGTSPEDRFDQIDRWKLLLSGAK